MTVLAVDDLFRSFGGIRAVDGVTFAVEQAEIVGIIGPNGSGKSTLFNLLTGALKPDKGTITLVRQEHHPARSSPDRPGRPRPHLPDPSAVREHDCAGEPLDRRGAVRLGQRHAPTRTPCWSGWSSLTSPTTSRAPCPAGSSGCWRWVGC